MTRKDYKVIARALADAKPGSGAPHATLLQWEWTVERMTAALDTFPNFDSEKFREATGYEGVTA